MFGYFNDSPNKDYNSNWRSHLLKNFGQLMNYEFNFVHITMPLPSINSSITNKRCVLKHQKILCATIRLERKQT